jgi:hypothetical protein
MIQVEIIRLIQNSEINSSVSRRTRQCKQKLKILIDTPLFMLPISRFHCTMLKNIDFCNIIRYNSRGPYQKFPTLIELYQKLFNETPPNMHNSLYDVYATLKCFLKIFS